MVDVKNVQKLKPLLPSLREKKRYLLFEVVSDKKFDQKDINDEISKAKSRFFGTYLSSKAGIQILKNKFEDESQRGILRVNVKYVDHLKTALGLITQVNNNDATIRTVKVSGILKKTI